MKIGIVELLGYDHNLSNVLIEHFHNRLLPLSLNEPLPSDLNLVIVPYSNLYCENWEYRKQVAESNLYNNLKIYSQQRGFIVGIQSGFEILCQAGLLPGSFSFQPATLFINQVINVQAEFKRSPLTFLMDFDKPIKLYLSHSMGGYTISSEELAMMRLRGDVLLRYCNEHKQYTKESNPDDSTDGIAAICNQQKSIFGITPIPSYKRCQQTKLQGLELIDSFFKMITR